MPTVPMPAADAGSSDADLACCIAAGDEHAFALLMRRHYRPLYRTARSTVKDDAEAEDVLQDAYLFAYRRSDRLSQVCRHIAGMQSIDRRGAWRHWTSGYGQDPSMILKAFEDGAEQVDELIVVRGILVYSHCEHHLAPFFGSAMIGHSPNGNIVGLAKLTRLVACFSNRLRLTIQITNALMEHVAPLSVDGSFISPFRRCASRSIWKRKSQHLDRRSHGGGNIFPIAGPFGSLNC